MTSIRCDEARALMMRVLDDDAPEPARPALETHLAACRGCAEAWRDQQSVHAWLAARPAAIPSPAFARRLDAELDALTPWWARVDWRWWTLRLAPVAAVLILLVGGTLGVTATSSSATQAPATAVSTALWDTSSTMSSDALLLAVLSGSPDDAVTRYEGRTR
jgi:anti-sigma factor RsiW